MRIEREDADERERERRGEREAEVKREPAQPEEDDSQSSLC